MGYRFRGFFSDGNAAVMAVAVSRWPFCSAKLISDPFFGFGLRAPDAEQEADTDEEYEQLLEQAFAIECGLVEFSRGFPAATFVYIDADCIGGTCVYTGFVAHDGVISLRIAEAQAGPEQLRLLLRPLGVQLPSGCFPPFVRGDWAAT